MASSVSFCSHGDSLLHPGVAAEQREHEASNVTSSDCASCRFTTAVWHKVSFMGQKLLSCSGDKSEGRGSRSNVLFWVVTNVHLIRTHAEMFGKKKFYLKKKMGPFIHLFQ